MLLHPASLPLRHRRNHKPTSRRLPPRSLPLPSTALIALTLIIVLQQDLIVTHFLESLVRGHVGSVNRVDRAFSIFDASPANILDSQKLPHFFPPLSLPLRPDHMMPADLPTTPPTQVLLIGLIIEMPLLLGNHVLHEGVAPGFGGPAVESRIRRRLRVRSLGRRPSFSVVAVVKQNLSKTELRHSSPVFAFLPPVTNLLAFWRFYDHFFVKRAPTAFFALDVGAVL